MSEMDCIFLYFKVLFCRHFYRHYLCIVHGVIELTFKETHN